MTALFVVVMAAVQLLFAQPWAGWLALETAVLGLMGPLFRLLTRRGAPHDKFTWE